MRPACLMSKVSTGHPVTTPQAGTTCNRDTTSARERDTGERGAAWAGTAARPEATGSTCRIAAKRLLTGGAYRVGVRLPNRGQAAACPHRDARAAKQPRLPPVNAARANGGLAAWGMSAATGHLPDRGQAADAHRRCLRVSVRLPDRGHVTDAHRRPSCGQPAAHIATPKPQATTPVDATRANGGDTGWPLPDRGQGLWVGHAHVATTGEIHASFLARRMRARCEPRRVVSSCRTGEMTIISTSQPMKLARGS